MVVLWRLRGLLEIPMRLWERIKCDKARGLVRLYVDTIVEMDTRYINRSTHPLQSA